MGELAGTRKTLAARSAYIRGSRVHRSSNGHSTSDLIDLIIPLLGEFNAHEAVGVFESSDGLRCRCG